MHNLTFCCDTQCLWKACISGSVKVTFLIAYIRWKKTFLFLDSVNWFDNLLLLATFLSSVWFKWIRYTSSPLASMTLHFSQSVWIYSVKDWFSWLLSTLLHQIAFNGHLFWKKTKEKKTTENNYISEMYFQIHCILVGLKKKNHKKLNVMPISNWRKIRTTNKLWPFRYKTTFNNKTLLDKQFKMNICNG